MQTLEKSNRAFVLHPKLLKHLSAVYNKLGNTNKAFANLNMYNLLKDSLDMDASTTKSLLLIAQKEYELINRKNKSNKLKLTFSIWVVSFLLLFFVVMLLMYLKIRKANLKLIEKALNSDASFVNRTKLSKQIKQNNEVSVDENLNSLVNDLEELMKNKKPYLDESFSLPKVAAMLSSNTSYLSKAINTILNKNFSTYINGYKIEYSIKLIESGEAEKITIEALALQSGFKNRSVLLTAFKNYTGVTPSFFINNYKSQL